MGLIDRLRKAEEQGRDVARKGLERARDAFGDTESRLRRKMRVRRNPEVPLRPSSPSPAATSGPAAMQSLPHHASEEDAA